MDPRFIRDNFNRRALRRWCNMSPTECFEKLGGKTHTRKNGRHAFLSRGARVLAVAHVDTVCKSTHFCDLTVDGKPAIVSSRLDDRLGVYIIVDLLPKLHINVDVLLTENEEVGASTAADFLTDKKYNWIVEFDRRGDDVVTYQYDWPNKTISNHFNMGLGSYSDISDLDHLGVNALNVGVGYHDEHSDLCYVVLPELFSQLCKFSAFYANNHDIRYKYTRKPTLYPRGNWWGNAFPASRPEQGIAWCDTCHKELPATMTLNIGGERCCVECGDAVHEFLIDTDELYRGRGRNLFDLDDDDDEWSSRLHSFKEAKKGR